MVSPKEILEKNDLRCPKCSATLTFDPSNLTISVNNNNKKGLLKLFQK